MSQGEENINFFRYFIISCNILCVIFIILAVLLPDHLPATVQIFLITVAFGTFVLLNLSIFLASKDFLITLILLLISSFLCGGVIAISFWLVVKNG